MLIAILIVLGLCLGSFTNALIWRFHEQSALRDEREVLRARKKQSAKDAARLMAIDRELRELSVLTGRSRCPACGHQLSALDLIPVFSYLALGRKCRYCRTPIPDTPIAEVVTPLLFVLSYVYWPMALQGSGLVLFLGWLVLLTGLVALAMYDLRWHELPHEMVFWLSVLAVLQTAAVALLFDGGLSYALNAAAGGLVISGIFVLLYRVSPKIPPSDIDPDAPSWYGPGARTFGWLFGWLAGNRESRWIGGGDITLGLLLGILAGGPAQAFLVVFLASLIGTLVMLPALALHRAGWQTKLPFGPFLIAAAVVVVLFGQRIIDWYTGLVLVV